MLFSISVFCGIESRSGLAVNFFEENLRYLSSPTITTLSYIIKGVMYCFQERQEIARELGERRKQEESKSKKVCV